MSPNPNLELRKLELGTPEYSRAMAMADTRAEDVDGHDNQTWPPARSVRYWVDLWGGAYSKTLTTPDGAKHHVSLEPWRDEDPETTFIAIRMKMLPGYQP